jgi:uncharacterized protein
MESLTIDTLILLFLFGATGGFVDSIAGGGGLITIPALLAAGMNPVAALATNKAQAMFGSFTASLTYARNGQVKLGNMKWAIIFTFIGSSLGTVAVQYLAVDFLTQMIPLLIALSALYFLFGPRVGEIDRHRYLAATPFYLIFGLSIGFYDGFFGPGTGSFWALAFVTILGFNMLKATAHTKVVNFTSNFASFLLFAWAGHVLWQPAAVMAIGQLLGAYLGAKSAIKHGTRMIKPLLVVISLIMTAKLIYDDPENIVHILVCYLF